jgi:TM2 domain-containing membrane protein YozV
MGFFDVPTVKRSPMGILCLILNIIPWAGIGSIIAGVVAKANNQIIKGVIQLLTGWLIIGWIWSIIDGIRMFMKSTP